MSIELAREIATVVKDIDRYQPNPNVAPTDIVPIVRSGQPGERVLELAQFGIAPRWSKPGTGPLLVMNARVETIYTKPMFQRLANAQRCIVPADGYYEWRTEGGQKQPYMFFRKDSKPMWLAGLWDKGSAGQADQFVIITGEPNTLSSPIHDRMPCLLDDEDVYRWLDVTRSADDALIVYASELMSVRTMSPAMNRSTVKDANVMEPELR